MGNLLHLAAWLAGIAAPAPLALPPRPASDLPGRLRVVGPAGPWATPLTPGSDGAATLDGRSGRQLDAAPPLSPPGSDWLVEQVGAGPVDEPHLAALLHDPALAARIAAGRRAHQLALTLGTGGGGLVAAGVGAYFTGWGSLPGATGRRDARALGVSLITVGVVGAVLGALLPVLRPPHVLARGEAEALCDTYNGRQPHVPAPPRPES